MRGMRWCAAVATLCVSATVWTSARQQPGAAAHGTADRPPEVGIAIPDKTVQAACGSCHRLDDKQQLSRISFQRNTPEGWEASVRRMVALNGLKIEAATARHVVKYLSDNLGLAPEEARSAAFEVERRASDYKYAADGDTDGVCSKCHSMGRVISQRRTRKEWELLIATHRGLYPLVDFQSFRRTGPPPRDPGPDGRPADKRHPMDKAIDHLSKAFPLQTSEWAAWSATMRPVQLEGTWALRGWEAGREAVYGRVVVKPSTTADELTTEITYTYPRTGESVSRTGRVMVYTGFQWRGRSRVGTDDNTALREVMFVDRDRQRIDGRWFTGGYDEVGLDIRLERVSGRPVLLGTDRQAVRMGTSNQEVRIYGAALPQGLPPSQIDFGRGITVTRVVNQSPDVVTVAIDVAPAATPGVRDLFVAGVGLPAALAIYDRVDAIKVAPSWAMARVGGVVFPKMLAQFEAWGYHNGADGKPDTADDIKLGVVPATWSMEEYAATYDEDDVRFVGTLDPSTGLFTPNVDGPNSQRTGNRNNVGDVWVVATYTPPPAESTPTAVHQSSGSSSAAPAAGSSAPVRPLRARAHLLVTVPLYMRWEPVTTR